MQAFRALTRRRPAPAPVSWVTHVRCHDDIGWAVSGDDAAAAGVDGFAHRRFLADFYAGDFPGSFGRGVRFQDNPATGTGTRPPGGTRRARWKPGCSA